MSSPTALHQQDGKMPTAQIVVLGGAGKGTKPAVLGAQIGGRGQEGGEGVFPWGTWATPKQILDPAAPWGWWMKKFRTALLKPRGAKFKLPPWLHLSAALIYLQ